MCRVSSAVQAKRQYSICLLYNVAETAFWLSIAKLSTLHEIFIECSRCWFDVGPASKTVANIMPALSLSFVFALYIDL